MELNSIGDHIRKRRLDLGLLQREAAQRIGADVTSLLNWEKGRASPELRFIPGVIGFLGYDPRPAAATLAERLVRFREAKGWTQARLAEELGVDQSTLARWERGERSPAGSHLRSVSVALGETLDCQVTKEAEL